MFRVLSNGLDVLAVIGVGTVATFSATLVELNQNHAEGEIPLGAESPSLLVLMVVAIFTGFIAKSFLSYFLIRRTALFLATVETRVAIEVAQQFFKQSKHQIEKTSQVELQWAVGQSMTVAFTVVLFAAATLVAEATLVMATLITVAIFEPWFGAGLVLFLVVSVLVFQGFIRGPLHRAGEVAAESAVEFSNNIFDLRALYFEARTYGTVPEFLERFGQARRTNSISRATQKSLMAMPRLVLEVMLFGALLAMALYLSATGSFVEGFALLALGLAAGLKITGALVPIQTSIAELRTYIPMAHRTHQILADLDLQREFPANAGEEENSTDAKGSLHAGPSSVTVRSVRLNFDGDSAPALEDISIEISPGQFVAIVGPTGSGKTTLANLILGLETPSHGEIRVDGLDPASGILQRSGRVAYVPQAPGIMRGSWEENVLLLRKKSTLQLSEFDVRKLLGDFDWSWMGSGANPLGPLSGGQKQLLALSRALINSPGLLVLDEFSSALDPTLEARISRALETVRPATTVIAIAHRFSTIKDADVIYFLDKGRVVNSGSFDELAAADERFIAFLEASKIR